MLKIAIAAAVLLALAALLWFSFRPKPKRAPGKAAKRRLRYPVVLAHGLLGFDEVRLAGLKREYFKGVADRVRQMGVEVYPAKVPAVGAVHQRAQELAALVKSIPAERVNVIAHSMGGLDARYAIAQLGVASKVASLTTLGTPHRGTPLADLGTKVGEHLGLKKVLSMIGIEASGLFELTSEKMEAFNKKVVDRSDVAYGCFVATARPKIIGSQLNPVLFPAYLFLSDRAGENDGIVPAESQKWGEVMGKIEADHWGQIGWSKRFDAPAFFDQLVGELRARGF